MSGENKLTEIELTEKARRQLMDKGVKVHYEVRIPFGNRKADLIGVGDEYVYVCECKDGRVRRPSQGLGQLLFCKGAIERKPAAFITELKSRFPDKQIPYAIRYRLYLWKGTTQEEKEAREILRSQLIPQVSIEEIEK